MGRVHRLLLVLTRCVLSWTEVATSTLLTKAEKPAEQIHYFQALPSLMLLPLDLSIDFTPTQGTESTVLSQLFAFRGGSVG